MSTRFSSYTLLAILLLAFALRMVVAANNLDTPLAFDEHEYTVRGEIGAKNLFADTNTFHPPLYPYALALVFRTVGEARFIISSYQALLDVLSVALMYILARLVFARQKISLLTAFLYAVSPAAVGMVGTVLSDTQFMCLTLLGFVLVLRAVKHSNWTCAFAGGIFLLLAALTREVVAYFAVLAIPLWWLGVTPLARRQRVLQTLVFLIGMFLVLVPVALHVSLLEGRFLLFSTSSEFNFARDNVRIAILVGQDSAQPNVTMNRQMFGELDAQPAATRTAYAYRRGWNAILQSGWYWLGAKADSLRSFWNPFHFENRNLGVVLLPANWMLIVSSVIVVYLAALMVFATIGFVAAPDSASKLLLVSFVLYSLVLFLVTHYQIRYRYPVHVFMTPYAAYGMWSIYRLVRARRFNARWISAPRFLIALLLLMLFVPLMLSSFIAP